MTAKKADPSLQARIAGLSSASLGLLSEAGQALGRRQIDRAERSLVRVLALAPRCAEANRLQGIAAQMRGNFPQALQSLKAAVAACPDDAMLQMNLGSVLSESGDLDAGLSHLERACELGPKRAAAWYNLGLAFKKQIRAEEAIAPLQRALALDPGHVAARLSLADTQVSLGEIPAAVRNYREILKRQPAHPKAWFELANLKTVPFDSGDVVQLRRLLKRADMPPEVRISLGFALSKALEDQNDHPGAFDVLAEANALKRRHVSWDASAESADIDEIMRSFDTPRPAPLDATLGREVIFIVSLPRSGSTLAEQILASHPQVEGANEITDLPQVIEEESSRRGQPFPQWVASATAADWSRLGRSYLQRTERWRQQRRRFTDKNLINWRLVGAMLAMLPGARVVLCHRDPLETCLACYRQLFSNGALFSYDLQEMVSYWRDYTRLSRHWRQLYPEQIIDFDYESLLDEPERQIRRLLNFCNLDFDPACLDFHQTRRAVLSTASAAQVRQPLQRGTARSTLYGDRLDYLRMLLADSGS